MLGQLKLAVELKKAKGELDTAIKSLPPFSPCLFISTYVVLILVVCAAVSNIVIFAKPTLVPFLHSGHQYVNLICGIYSIIFAVVIAILQIPMRLFTKIPLISFYHQTYYARSATIFFLVLPTSITILSCVPALLMIGIAITYFASALKGEAPHLVSGDDERSSYTVLEQKESFLDKSSSSSSSSKQGSGAATGRMAALLQADEDF